MLNLLDAKDKSLLALLSANSRESTAELARKLELSRSTVKDRMQRLEKQGVINGYTIRYSEEYASGQIRAQVMISYDPKLASQIVRHLRQLPAVKAVYAVNGIYDMIAHVSADSTLDLDTTLDRIGDIDGVEKTVSSIILSTKFER
ncbi:MAG: Lrp/AsnC family transcriptional regulator [Pseudohongiellaceae bacterium]